MEDTRILTARLCDTLKDIYQLELAVARSIELIITDAELNHETINHFGYMLQRSLDQVSRLKLAFHLLQGASHGSAWENRVCLKPILQKTVEGEEASESGHGIAFAILLARPRTTSSYAHNLENDRRSTVAAASCLLLGAANQNEVGIHCQSK